MAWDEAQYVINKVSKKIDTSIVNSGGLSPHDMTACSATAANESAILTWTLPSDTILDGEVIVEVAGVMVRRKVGEAPINTLDGDLVFVSADRIGSYTDENLENGVNYYYRFFPYSTDNVYNISPTGIVQCVPREVRVKTWGFHEDFNDSNPDTRITYPLNVENSGFTPMVANSEFTRTPGSWEFFLRDTLKNFPFMVKTNGEADYQLNNKNYSLKIDGTNSDAENANYNGVGAFAWLNKIYMKEVYDADEHGRTVYFSDGPQSGFEPVGFVDGDNNELEGLWIPIFYQNADNNKTLMSASLAKSLTTAQQKAKIDAVGLRARFFGGPIMNVLRDLEYMLFKSTDIQKQAGYGNCEGGSEASMKNNAKPPYGDLDIIPGFYGRRDKVSCGCMFHSVPLGQYDQWLRDPYTMLVDGVFKYSKNYEYDETGASYETSQESSESWGALNGGWHYPKAFEYTGDGFGSTPKKENVASTTTGLCDGLIGNTSGVRVGLRLGDCSSGLNDGPATLFLSNEASVANWNVGAAVLLLPADGYTPFD